LAEEARRLAEELGVDALELRTRHVVGSSLVRSERKIKVILDLPESADTLWNERFRTKLRAQIRRPLKEGMEVRFGRDQLPAFYEVFARNMRDLGTPVLPRRYFEAVAEMLGAAAVFAAVWWGGRPVAGSYGAVWGDEFEMVRASSLREHNRMAPNMLLYWGCMCEMISRGVRRFSFGRCSPGGGTHRFKQQWGGREVPLPWLSWGRNGTPPRPPAERSLLRFASAVWTRLPMPVANRLGPFFARRLP
jgi:FemAB-related protein (PEP-CTERM system-associated)